MKKIGRWSLVFLSVVLCLLPELAFAHENYVLTKGQIQADVAYHGPGLLSVLKDAGNVRVSLAVAASSLLVVILYFFFQRSAWGFTFDKQIKKLEPFGHVMLRLALAASLIASAHFYAFLGPEIPLASLPLGMVIKSLLYVLGIFLAVGLWSESVGLLALLVLVMATWIYKDYMITYCNYFGEFIALILYGSRVLSLDKIIHKARAVSARHKNFELALIRVTYGISVMYPAITYKLIHPQVIVDIVQRYNLTQFHRLFPHDPLLIALGAGMAQVVVGLFLVIGFETRLSTLITFILMTLSVLFFKEAVWPHLVLLALALYLMINNGGNWSLDKYLEHKT